MAEEVKVAETPAPEVKASEKTIETKSTVTETKADAKAPVEKAVTPDDKAKPATDTKAETPAEELKTLLDEAGEEKVETKEGEEKVIPAKYEFKLPEGMTLDE